MMQRYLRPAGRGSSMDEATLKREDAGVSDFGGNEERVKKHGTKPFYAIGFDCTEPIFFFLKFSAGSHT